MRIFWDFWQAMAGHDRPWQAMAGHSRPWPAMKSGGVAAGRRERERGGREVGATDTLD